MDSSHVEDLQEKGYAIIRGFMPPEEMGRIAEAVDQMYQEGMTHHASYHHQNLCFELLNDPVLKRKIVVQAYWFSWINKTLEEQRRHPKYLEVLGPLLGKNIKQIANQIHWKPPGAKYSDYRFHQDLRFREKPEDFSNITTHNFTTALAIDPQTAENGALQFFPGSHKKGYLGLSDGGTIMNGGDERSKGPTKAEELVGAKLDPKDAVLAEMEPGDLAIWGLLTVHGSKGNQSRTMDRRVILNSYVRAEDSPIRGEWVFKDGVSTPLGPEPQLCKYENLYTRPGPYYVKGDWVAGQ
ncbi:MAG: phytanoyl-CoA dioxygenase family protein [Alphaproteobacteria bacterium]